MNNETNRLAQIIATEADKYRAIRAGALPTGQDKAAAEAIEAEYLFIRRSELPIAEIVDRDGVPHVDVGSDAGTWSCKTSNSDYARTTGLEYLAAADAIDKWRAEQEQVKLQNRRDELAREIAGEAEKDPDCQVNYKGMVLTARIAIDRIIELERNAA